MQCAFHPDTETLLRCSKCEKPICNRCAIMTPVGARCPECAHAQRLPTYNLPTVQLLRAIGVAIVVGVALGVSLGLFQDAIPLGLGWVYVPAVFIGSGYLVGEAISRVTNRKRAPALQGLAIGGYALALIVFTIVSPGPLLIGLYSLIGLVVGGAMALNPFR